MNVAIISDAFPPQRTSAAVQIRDLAAEILRQGHRPIVVVPAPELTQKWVLEEYRNIRVLRARTMKMKDVNYTRRVLAEALMPLMMLLRLHQSGLNRENWDGIVWYSPSIFFGPLVMYLKRKHRCRSYLILRDIFPEWAVDMGVMRRGLPYRFFKVIEKIQYRAADTIGIQSDAARSYLQEFLEPQTPNIELLRNWLTDSETGECSIDITATCLTGRKICVYTGNLGVAQDAGIFLNLASALRYRNDFGFLFVGRGSEVQRLKDIAEAERLDNVLFHDEIEPDEIAGLLEQCHVGLLALDPRHSTINIPGKFLAYLRSSLPVLACVNVNNDLIAMIEHNALGYAPRSRNLEDIQKNLLSLLQSEADRRKIGRNCRAVYESIFSSQAAAREVLQDVILDENH